MARPPFTTWLYASRPRTLLLATASIGMGILLALSQGFRDWPVALLTLLTATLLQILSNLANDYGDARHGVDDAARLGPKRAVQSGMVSARSMLRAVIMTAVLAAASGLWLVWLAFDANILITLLFVALGALAIWAAIAYTATDKPYGYIGLGDIVVFLFFGWLAVLGAYYLQANSLSWDLLLPATASGLLSVAVLNINNVRDLESDARTGKRSLPVRLGPRRARIYHVLLLLGTALSALAYVLINYSSPWQFLFVLALPLLGLNGISLWRGRHPAEIDPLLKQMSLSTLAFTALFGLGQVLA